MPTTLFKPAGTTVFPLHADPDSECVLRQLLVQEPWRDGVEWPAGFEGGISHRLDRSTSGALLVADDVEELLAIREAFRDGGFRKTYRFLAAKEVSWSTNTCERPIAHSRKSRRRMVVQRGAHTAHRGKWYPAHTEFRRVEGRLWEAVITTGVMHQIRIHGAFLGIPLLGDTLYGGGPGERFLLHHVGMRGPWCTQTVPTPSWAVSTGRR